MIFMIKLMLESEKADDIEARLKKMQDIFTEKFILLTCMKWKRIDNKFWIRIDYDSDNRIFDAIIRRKFAERIKKADPDAKLEWLSGKDKKKKGDEKLF